MEIIIRPFAAEWEELCRRNIPNDNDIEERVGEIIEKVRKDGDSALREYASKFDGYSGESLKLTEDEILEACGKVKDDVREAIDIAAGNIRLFHESQISPTVDVETMPGIRCVQKSVAIGRVGLYIPGGRAPLFSTVLMLAIPARLAGCKEVVMCTPESGEYGISPEILYAAHICGVDSIYRVGGAQAIASMAYGTESIPTVDKIFGPGNRYVTKAKQILSRVVAIDMPAGPSEVMVMADATCNPAFVAADMLSQAEHGPDSQAIVVCDSEELAMNIAEELELQSYRLPRRDSIMGSLSHSRIIVIPSHRLMIDFANEYAPEHLIISMINPWDVAKGINAAGSVFIGNYSPESVGDYASGTNHTLPTSGWARSFSGVNIDSFMRKITYQELTPEGLERIKDVVTTMARAEGLEAHARAAEIRANECRKY